MHRGPVIAVNKIGDETINVLDCDVCGYAHLENLPTQKELDEYYLKDLFYKTHSSKDWFEKNKREHRHGYWFSQYEYQDRQLNVGSVLDYGSGDGWFIRYYKNAVGVEPSQLARSYCNDLYIVSDIQHLRGVKYYNIRMSLVLEHILEPYPLIYNLMDYGYNNHKIQIIVPNEFNPLQNKIRERLSCDWFVQKPHINYFTKESIIKLVKRCGYYITDTCGTFPMELFYLMGFKYIGDDNLGRKCHNIRLNFERTFGVNAYKLYRVLYNKLGWGRESIITASRERQK